MRDFTNYRQDVRRVTGRQGTFTKAKTTLPEKTKGVTCLTTSLGQDIYSATLFPTLQAIALIRTSQFLLPMRCVKCNRSSTRQETLVAHSLWPFPVGWLNRFVRLPYCGEHSADAYPGAILECESLHTYHCMIVCLSTNELFVKELFDSVRVGDMAPPWVAFPSSEPHIRWAQGIQGSWWNDAWLPFWTSLSEGDRKTYIQRWHAPVVWLHHLQENP